jgi:hypothetical protein
MFNWGKYDFLGDRVIYALVHLQQKSRDYGTRDLGGQWPDRSEWTAQRTRWRINERPTISQPLSCQLSFAATGDEWYIFAARQGERQYRGNMKCHWFRKFLSEQDGVNELVQNLSCVRSSRITHGALR